MTAMLVGANLSHRAEQAGGNVPADPFERLFLREYPRVVSIARRVLGDAQAAEDVAQDAFVAFHRRLDPSAHYAAAWLHRAAVHGALNYLRGRQRRERRETTRAVLDARETPASDADPLVTALRREERSEVRSTLRRLSARSAAVLVLRYAGLSYDEVGAALGVKASHVGTLLVRAESAFKKEFDRVTPR
jgi:RNA polymerase sigma-70 factor (ECF subfamily)